MKLPQARSGQPLRIRGANPDFTFNMMRRDSKRRWGVHSMLYAADPWAVILGAVQQEMRSSAQTDRDQAASFVRQAREYFRAAEQAHAEEPRPLLYYYAFMNLSKALAACRGRAISSRTTHGISPVGPTPPATRYAPDTSEVSLQASGPVRGSVVDEVHQALEGRPVTATTYTVKSLMAQSVVGHRMWLSAAGLKKERFVPVHAVVLREDPSKKRMWSVVCVTREALRTRGRALQTTLVESGLSGTHRAVNDPSLMGLHAFEQEVPTTYTHRASDEVMTAVRLLRPALWQTVTASPPYRRYYMCLTPTTDKRLPQWLSVYALLFWLGSLSRYQPLDLLHALDGEFGPFLREFLETQPHQLLYFYASEFKRQDVAKAAVV